jgi:phage terminase large subunit-like protein
MSSQRNAKSAPKLYGYQEPTLLVKPKGKLNLDLADDADFLADAYGLTLDDWQRRTLELILARRTVGPTTRWACYQAGISVPRQNGKNGALEAVVITEMSDMGRKILFTAHELKTARKMFQRLCRYYDERSPYAELVDDVREIRRANGQEAIILHNGGSIEFVARSKGSGLGFTGDTLILDEAQECSDIAFEALLPLISAAPSKDPRVIMLGTPPTPTMDGTVFTRLRKSALATTEKRSSPVGVPGTATRIGWIEWGVQTGEGLDLDSEETWARFNPAYGIRINRDTVLSERIAMSDAAFSRARLGMWSSEQKLEIINTETWADLATHQPPPADARRVFAVDMTPERDRACVAIALDIGDDMTHTELALSIDTSNGTGQLIDWLTDKRRRTTPIVIDQKSPAAALTNDLTRAGCRVTTTGTADYIAACSNFLDRINGHQITHYNQPPLNNAVKHVAKRNIGEAGWSWSRKSSDADISPLVAATLATWGLWNRRKVHSRTPGAPRGARMKVS